jgi:hypothetical protein
VLDSVHGVQDQAVDVLLGMNDPSFVSTATAPDVRPPPPTYLKC